MYLLSSGNIGDRITWSALLSELFIYDEALEFKLSRVQLKKVGTSADLNS